MRSGYANTGVGHPSDALIDEMRGRALLQIDEAKEKAQRYNAETDSPHTQFFSRKCLRVGQTLRVPTWHFC